MAETFAAPMGAVREQKPQRPGEPGAGLQLDFDPDALRAKYRAERERRLRPEGEGQYDELTGHLAHYAEHDPYVAADFTRAPLTDEVEVLIIGGGFCGLLAAARLREAGVADIRILEAGGDFGGTWYWNRYPGAQCDIESYSYLPLLEELNYVPKEKYSYVTEIFEHAQRIGRAYNLYDSACFQTSVREIRWDEAAKRWTVRTNRDDAMRARFVIMAAGTLNRAKLPHIPGRESFEGHTFHTSRWDYAYTGGSTLGNLDKLGDKRVAIIGTGATAIQAIPHLGRHAKHLYVFQRTPSSVGVRGNKPTDPDWAASLKPGWQRERRANFTDITLGLPVEEDLVNDAWTDMYKKLQTLRPFKVQGDLSPEEAAYHAEIADFMQMNQIRARVDEMVADPGIAEQLKPWYRQYCKRPTFNDDFLPTFNRPNVTLVDTSHSKGVERITPKGLVANGVEYEVDCIIYSTGFQANSTFRKRFDFEIVGRDGASLFDAWSTGVRTLHGHSTRGFPNWFFLGVSQNAISFNMTSMFDDQAQHVAYIIREATKRGASTVEPTAEGEAAWVRTIRDLSVVNRDFLNSCTPGIFNNEGNLRSSESFFSEAYSPGVNAFNQLLADWRADGRMDGLELGS